MNKTTFAVGGAVIGAVVLGGLTGGWFWALVGAGALAFVGHKIGPDESATPTTIQEEGYTKNTVGDLVAQRREQLVRIRTHGRKITENLDDDEQRTKFETSVGNTCSKVERVLANLEQDPGDMQFMGMLLEALDPLEKALGLCGKLAFQGVSGDGLKNALAAADTTLANTAEIYDRKLNGSLQMNDLIKITGQLASVNEMTGATNG